MFNTLPNVRLAGENWNILYQASHLYKVFENHPEDFLDTEFMNRGRFMHGAIEDGPFQHNPMPMGSMSCVMQQLISFLNPPNLKQTGLSKYDPEEEEKKIVGVKVIRLQAGKWVPRRAKRFLTESFPCARFIINIRSNVTEQSQSILSNFEPLKGDKVPNYTFDEIVEKFNNQTNFLKELAVHLGKQKAMLLDMNAWKNDVSILNNVIDWLGFENCAFERVKHENFDGFGRDEDSFHLGKDCRYPYV